MDPVANMLVAIKNGYLANKKSVKVPYSKFKYQIAKVLEKAEKVSSIKKEEKQLMINLAYADGKPNINDIKRVSKLGLRVYIKKKNIKPVKGGKGFYVISTPSGVMSSNEAIKKNLGGEVICLIW